MSLQLQENFLSLGILLAWLYRCTECMGTCWLTSKALESLEGECPRCSEGSS